MYNSESSALTAWCTTIYETSQKLNFLKDKLKKFNVEGTATDHEACPQSETVSFKQFWKGNDNLVLLKGINLFISYTLYKLFGVSWVWKDTVAPTQVMIIIIFFLSLRSK